MRPRTPRRSAAPSVRFLNGARLFSAGVDSCTSLRIGGRLVACTVTRVELEQGEQWFRALRHFGKTAELVIFSRENQNLTRTGEPRHPVESLDWQVYWFTRYLEGAADLGAAGSEVT